MKIALPSTQCITFIHHSSYILHITYCKTMAVTGKKSTKATEQFSSTARIRVQHPDAELLVTTRLQALLFMTKCLLGAVKLKAIACIKLPRPQLNGFGKSVLRKQGVPLEKKKQSCEAMKINMGLVITVLRKTCNEHTPWKIHPTASQYKRQQSYLQHG